MLEVRNLAIHIDKENRTIIDNLSFTLNRGDKFAVIGLEGNGKSTLLKAIYNPQSLDYCDVKGVINIKGKVGYLPQTILEEWYDVPVYDYLLKEYPDSEIKLESYELLGKLDQVLTRLRFDSNLIDHNPKLNHFSGGELVKLGLAKILLHEPDLLLLDEPTNDLDLETIIFLENFILNEERPLLFVSHDEKLLENASNGIIHLSLIHKKRKPTHEVVKMNYRDYKEFRKLALDSQEMIARKQRADYKKKMERFRQIYSRVETAQDQTVRNPSTGRLLKKKIHALKSIERRLEKEKAEFLEIPEREEAIDLFFEEDVLIPKGKVVLDFYLAPLKINERILAQEVKLYVQGDAKVAIIGKNGCGKSTLLKCIYDDLKNREDISVGYMSQKYEELFISNDSALHYVMKTSGVYDEARIRKIMGALQFTREEMENKTSQLSGGQKVKLLFLKMVLSKNNVLLLDEPTRNLSPLSAPVIHNLLLNYKGCVICITHDRKFLEEVFDEVYELTEKGLIKLI